MIKGVSRLVLEIPQPESAYFDSVLLFVKPACADRDPDALKRKAASLLRDAAVTPVRRRSGRGRFLRIASYVLTALVSAVATGLIAALF